MVRLTTAQKRQVLAEFSEELSATRTTIPARKQNIVAVLDRIDAGLEGMEAATFAALAEGAARTWLVANQSIGRRLIELCEGKRREVL